MHIIKVKKKKKKVSPYQGLLFSTCVSLGTRRKTALTQKILDSIAIDHGGWVVNES